MMTQLSRYQKLNPGLLAAAAMMALIPVMIEPLHAHGGGKHETTKEDSNHGSDGYRKAAPPASGVEAWAMIRSGVSQIQEALAARDLKLIHEAERNVGTSLQWLQENSFEVSGDKVKRLKSALKQAVVLSGNLHAAADAEDQAKSEAEFEKLQNALKLVEVQYPNAYLGKLK